MLKKFKKKLRAEQTDVENYLWRLLRNRRFIDAKFRRQHQIQNFIVDFVCLENKIIIEIDGSQHQNNYKDDSKRTALLQREGFRVLRFWNNEVLTNTSGVLEIIYNVLITPHPPR